MQPRSSEHDSWGITNRSKRKSLIKIYDEMQSHIKAIFNGFESFKTEIREQHKVLEKDKEKFNEEKSKWVIEKEHIRKANPLGEICELNVGGSQKGLKVSR